MNRLHAPGLLSLLVLALAPLAGCTSPPQPGPGELRGEVRAAPVEGEGGVAAPDPAPPAPPAPAALPGAEARAAAVASLRRALDAAESVAAREAAFAEVLRAAPSMSGWVALLRAEEAATGAELAAVERAIGTGTFEGASAEWAWRPAVALLERRGDRAGAALAAQRGAEGATTPLAVASAWLTAGELRASIGEVEGAREALVRAIQADPGSRAGLEAARAAVSLPGLSPEQRVVVGRGLLAHGGIDRGVASLEAALAAGLPAEQASAVRLEAGRALFRARRYAPAEPLLRAAASASPEAMFLHGRALYRMGRQTDGVARFRETARLHPTDPFAAEALFLLGDLEQGSGRNQAAAELYRQVLLTGARTEIVGEAGARLAAILLHTGRPTEVASALAPLASSTRADHRAIAYFWTGQAQQRLGDGAAARASWTRAFEADAFSYYGVRAVEALGGTLADARLAPTPSLPLASAHVVGISLLNAELLRAAGREEAEYEIAWLRSRFSDSPEVLYEVAEGMIAGGQPIAGALVGRTIRQARGEWDDRLLRIVFQFPFEELVKRESRRQGLDPYMVAGLIRQESFFNPVAVSPAGAIGLMQVMPETGRGLARRVGINGYQPSMLRDPETNVRLGTLFLADQLRRWGGREIDAFIAYNAGPGRISRWRDLPEYRDTHVFVERIPIAETRDYVKKVTLHTAIYRRLYADP